MHSSAHSPRTFSSPRKRNCRNPRSCLICPNTGSTMNFRVAYTAAPTLVCSFRSIRSTRLAPFGNGPGLQGSRRSLCFCFPVATNPSIFLFFRYFRFSSEQYPLVRQNSFWCLPRLFFDRLHQRHQLFIVRGLRDP